ncbi:adipokinetic hormone/corazonin-related peptide receptor variant I-like [Schistocerca gregaria]|uniref:adipokinetic hormone/corazonin-related peptide receptor variant I-like n=1 Tax=Schistocerca gregaria TaxID=7010 RepID=UPI00211E0CD1|nr:adipokinetic hormone/corazonin-related peptide receptor variant I-like [Schistocerca gregaria]
MGEVGWRLTTQWVAGDAACKVFLLLRAFGLYLSSNVLVCVSLDRYFAVLHPLKVNDARRRGKIMLVFAWLIAFACSVPQVSHQKFYMIFEYSSIIATPGEMASQQDMWPIAAEVNHVECSSAAVTAPSLHPSSKGWLAGQHVVSSVPDTG